MPSNVPSHFDEIKRSKVKSEETGKSQSAAEPRMNGVRSMRRGGGLRDGRGARGKSQPNKEKRGGKGKSNGYCGENVMDEMPVDVKFARDQQSLAFAADTR
eukprot:948412_1